MIAKTIKIASRVLLFAVVLVAVLLLIVQTPLFKSWLAATAGKAASRSLNADVAIGSIHGNLLGNFEIKDVTLSIKSDTIAFVPRISLRYSSRELLSRRLLVDSLIIENPQLSFKQFPDSSWQFSQLVPAQKDTAAKEEENEFGISVDVRKFAITNGDVQIKSYHKTLPEKIDSLNLSIAALRAASKFEINLKHLSLKTHSPDFELKQLSFFLLQDSEKTSLDQFIFKTGKNQLVAQANVDGSAPSNATLQANAEDSDLSEFSVFIPALAMLGKPSLSIDAKTINNDFKTEINISSQQSLIAISGLVKNYASLLEGTSTDDLVYELGCNFENVSLSDLLPDNPTRALVNMDAKIAGVGISKEKTVARADVLIFDSTVEKRDIDTLRVAAAYKNSGIAGDMHLISRAGTLDVDFEIDDVWDLRAYTLLMSGRNINVQSILLDESFDSSLNVDISSKGAAPDWDNLAGEISVRMDSSTVMDIPIDTLLFAGIFSTTQFQIESLVFDNSIASLNGRGNLSLNRDSDVLVNLAIKDATPLASLLSIDTLAVQGNVSAHIQGTPDSLTLNGRLVASDLIFNAISFDSLHSKFEAGLINKAWSVSGAAKIDSLDANGTKVNTIQLETLYKNERIESQLNIEISEDINSNMQLIVQNFEAPQLHAPHLSINVKGHEWRGEDITLRFADNAIWFDQFRLYSNVNDNTQSDMEINGVVRAGGEENVQMKISNLDLSLLASFIPAAGDLEGELGMTMSIGGTAAHPEISTNLKMKDGRYKDYSVNRIEAKAEYLENELSANLLVAPLSDSLQIAARLPMSLSFDPPLIQIDKEAPLELRIVTEEFPIQHAFDQNKSPQFAVGDLSINLQAENSWPNLVPNGFVQFENGRVAVEKFGALFENIGFRLNVNPDSVVIEKVLAKRGKGKISASGFAVPSHDFSLGILDTFQVKLELDRYMLSTKPEHKVQVSSKITLFGSQNDFQFNGDVQVLQSSFYLPALLKKSTPKSDLDAPLLVQAISVAPVDTVEVETGDSITIKIDTPDYVKNMRGTIHLSIPKNTWIKSENMRIELGGELDIHKEKNITIAGAINVLRGQIDYLGRRFLLTKGEIVFQNREQIDPIIDITADYRFRDIHNKKRNLTLQTSGNLSKPNINFVMDDAEITNEEAISYILFQRAPGELGVEEQASSSVKTERMATNFLYGMASSRLSRRISTSLGLDYMEIKGQENWNSATFVMGKYLTPDLFISYEHSVGALEEDRKPQVMTVEYELTKYFFLQLISGDTKTTGADIIFKINK
jgi:translocation and assembly module TamB